MTEQLSHLLGVTVVGVSRNAPAHRDGAVVWDSGTAEPRREMWFVRLADGRYLQVESRDVRKAREFSTLLRRYGSRATLNNRMCRTALKLMHEILEMEQS